MDTCGWCNNSNEDHSIEEMHDDWCQKPQIVGKSVINDARDYEYLQLKLNKYQASNLFWLMHLTMGVEPFDAAHSGDWNGEIYNMLEYCKKHFEDYEPNMSDKEAVERAKDWALAVKIIES